MRHYLSVLVTNPRSGLAPLFATPDTRFCGLWVYPQLDGELLPQRPSFGEVLVGNLGAIALGCNNIFFVEGCASAAVLQMIFGHFHKVEMNFQEKW